MSYEKAYISTNVNNMIANVFGTAINSTVSWLDMLVLVVICGLIFAIFIGFIFKASHSLGFG
jgi:hypothetical protein